MTEFRKITELDPITEITNEDYVEVSQKQDVGTEDPYLTKRFSPGTFTNLNFWYGTQLEYDALGTYDDGTLYLIREEISS
jgi:hypothetical protein